MVIHILRWVLRLVGLACIFASILLFRQEIARFRAGSGFYPAGSMVAGIPVGGLNQDQARQRLEQVYALPVQLRCAETFFQSSPADLGFSLDLDSMLSAADQDQSGFSWKAYWDYLQGQTSGPVNIPLSATIDQTKLRAYLTGQVSPRCSDPPQPGMPYPGMLDFVRGQGGTTLDIEASLPLIQKAVLSLDQRVVDLPASNLPPPPVSMQNLETFLKQTIRLSNFSGIAGVYLSDLKSGGEFTFVLNHGSEVDKPEAVAFTGASTIKIPIMIAVMRKVPELPERGHNRPPEADDRFLQQRRFGLAHEEPDRPAARSPHCYRGYAHPWPAEHIFSRILRPAFPAA